MRMMRMTCVDDHSLLRLPLLYPLILLPLLNAHTKSNCGNRVAVAAENINTITTTMKYLIAFICFAASITQHCVVSAWSQGGIAITTRRAPILQQRKSNDHCRLLMPTSSSSLFSSTPNNDQENVTINSNNGELERLKKEEQRLSALP